jgi:hypothetical protein
VPSIRLTLSKGNEGAMKRKKENKPALNQYEEKE